MSFPVAPPPLKLPTQYDLPYDDDEPTDSWDALMQVELLLGTLYLTRHGRESSIGASNFVYYEPVPPAYPLLPKKLSPDLFVVPNTTPELRRSWVRWEQGGRLPSFVLELLSDGTEARDFGEKRRIYEHEWGVQDYVLYDPVDGRLRVFHRVAGQFAELRPDAQGRYWLASLGLYLVRWEGTYRGFTREWVRFADADGNLVLTPEERTEQESEFRADAEARSREAHDRRQMAESDRAAAEARAAEEAGQRVVAEARAAEEAAQRAAAEARAAEEAARCAAAETQAREEAAQRVAAEAQLREMERQLNEMRARLGQSS